MNGFHPGCARGRDPGKSPDGNPCPGVPRAPLPARANPPPQPPGLADPKYPPPPPPPMAVNDPIPTGPNIILFPPLDPDPPPVPAPVGPVPPAPPPPIVIA